MTWQGGKRPPDVGPLSPFARLKPLVGERDDAAKGLEALARALRGYRGAVSIHVRLISGADGKTVQDWLVQAGSKGGKAQRKKPKDADVTLVMRPETWTQIAQGRLAPYDALYGGKVRVGGNFEAAKAVTRFLTDPALPYVAPC